MVARSEWQRAIENCNRAVKGRDKAGRVPLGVANVVSPELTGQIPNLATIYGSEGWANHVTSEQKHRAAQAKPRRLEV
jgi:hypothetical protein